MKAIPNPDEAAAIAVALELLAATETREPVGTHAGSRWARAARVYDGGSTFDRSWRNVRELP